MSNTPQTEAKRLADRTTPYHGPHAQAMASELLRLDALVAHLTADRDNVATELAARTEANRALEAERDQLRTQVDRLQGGEVLGYINAGHLHEMQCGRVPYVYVYAATGVGAEVPVYTAPSQPGATNT